MSAKVATPPVMPAARMTGTNSNGFFKRLAIWILGEPITWAMVPPIGLTVALIQASVNAPATIPALAAPAPTPARLIAVAMPTDDKGDTIKAAKAIPKMMPMGRGEKCVALATSDPINP